MTFESILYNADDKEIAIVLGYGIGSHLSLKYLTEIVNDIRKAFPTLTQEQGENLKFLEVAQSSRSHKYHWYTRFHMDLSKEYATHNSGYFFTHEPSQLRIYGFCAHKNNQRLPDESAASIMNRLIHD